MIDEVIVWMRILGIAAAAGVIATWLPVARCLVLNGDCKRIHHMAMGICLAALGSAGISIYSFLLREHDMWDLRFTPVAPFFVGLEVLGIVYLGLAYFAQPGSHKLPQRKVGLYVAALAAIVMTIIKLAV